MKIQTKMVALVLLGTVAFGADYGTVAEVSAITIDTSNAGTNMLVSGSSIADNTVGITIQNNKEEGYEVKASSSNAGKMFNDASGADTSLDGHNIHYDLVCDSAFDSYATVSDLTLTTTPTNLIHTGTPNKATPSTASTCTIDIHNDESYDELLAGTFTDTITLTYASPAS